MYIQRCKTFKKHFKQTIGVKFKNMTQEQKDWGKVISIVIVTAILLVGALSSCSSLLYPSNQVMVTHVLALTEMGDTVKIRIDKIRPQQVYNVVGYDFVRYMDNRFYNPYNDRMYDYRYNHNRWTYLGNPGGTYGSITPNPNINSNQPIIVNPSGSQNYGGNTTGGGGNPVAVNPVTSGGGSSRGKNN